MVRIVDMERMFYVNIRIGKTFFSVLIRCTSATNSLAQCLPLADSPLVNTESDNSSNITTAATTVAGNTPKPSGKPVFQALASLVDARLRCLANGNKFAAQHEERILAIVKEELPGGSGIDCGTKIDLDKSTGDKLVFNVAYHHMNDGGYYDGWTEHVVTVKPSLMFDIELSISGRDRNQIKEYLYETYQCALTEGVNL
jgi:hypothetical protein